MSFLSALFGGRDAAKAEKPSEPVEYKGFIIRAAPFKSEGQFQTAGPSSARSAAFARSTVSSAPTRLLLTTMR